MRNEWGTCAMMQTFVLVVGDMRIDDGPDWRRDWRREGALFMDEIRTKRSKGSSFNSRPETERLKQNGKSSSSSHRQSTESALESPRTSPDKKRRKANN